MGGVVKEGTTWTYTKDGKKSVPTKFYDVTNLPGTILEESVSGESTDSANTILVNIKTKINPHKTTGAVDSETDSLQQFIRPGHYIKIDNEIMFVSFTRLHSLTDDYHYFSDSGYDYMALGCYRAQMGTELEAHTVAENEEDTPSVQIVSPVLKFPAGTKGRNLSIRLKNQAGYVDSIGVVYKPKSVK